MLELSGQLNQRAAGLAADAKQKISLGRGLVREDVSAVLFDEPLTVIDPHLKWQLRRKLKEIHHELQLTLIYVTHDQVEALTFAEQVVVMTRGRAVQVGRADQLFERPQHTFVGHFIGSPGMNFLPARFDDGRLLIGEQRLSAPPERASALQQAGDFTLGVRPEYVQLGRGGRPDRPARPGGRRRWTSARIGSSPDRWANRPCARASRPTTRRPRCRRHRLWAARLVGSHTCYYRNEHLGIGR